MTAQEPRRVGIVFPAVHQVGGVERVAWEMARFFASRHDVTVVATKWEAGGQNGIRHAGVPLGPGPRSLAPVRFRFAAERTVRPLPLDVSVTHGVECPPGDVLYVQSVHRAWLSRGRPARISGISLPNQLRYALPRHQVLLGLERAYFRSGRPKAVIAVSRQVADDLNRLYGVPAEKVTIVPNGYPESICSPNRRNAIRGEARESLGLGPDDVVLLMVANELHRKGFPVLVKAVARLHDERLRIHLIGKTPPDQYWPLVQRLGLEGRVRYHGLVADVGLFHAAADLFVLPTQYEAFSLAVVESLASGLPVITTTVPGAGDTIRPGVNGLLQSDPLDVDELAELLRAGLEPEARAAWSASAPASVAQYGWSSVMQQVEKVVLSV